MDERRAECVNGYLIVETVGVDELGKTMERKKTLLKCELG